MEVVMAVLRLSVACGDALSEVICDLCCPMLMSRAVESGA